MEKIHFIKLKISNSIVSKIKCRKIEGRVQIKTCILRHIHMGISAIPFDLLRLSFRRLIPSIHISLSSFLYVTVSFQEFSYDKWYFVTKIVLTYCEKKNCSSDREKLLKFEAEGREFAKCLRSLEQFI